MRLAILGAGAIALGSAALAASRGHAVTVWSPSGRGTEALRARGGRLAAAGEVRGEFPVGLAAQVGEAVAGAEAVLVAVPANGHRAVMEAAAPHLASGQTVLVSAAASLSPLHLHRLLGRRGVAATIAGFGTTALTGRRGADGASVAVATLRGACDVAAVRHAETEAALAIATELWGERFVPADSLLAAALANVNPIAHLAMALCNLSRIEHREVWPQYHCTTPAVARLILALDGERQALAAACGVRIPTAEAFFRRSYALDAPDLAGMMAELHARRGGPPGPTTIETRYVLEDVPFGLVFYLALAGEVGLAMPVTEGAVRLASAAWGRELAAMNDLLPVLAAEGGLRAAATA
ncbi:NAD/NADP-dependent octopine/nopaline dehydrogenase family protein [Elioraea sp. Yellowstone]|jgi:opine dehydrogenase|uniref:NAD/NADP-dependent octopine/nopaline dehydrogenase family protein n=1 Tax=Elioraea sp. Yellowstone TaxID=2592070 RepID=UPI0013870524|nr:NAD/NADP-dependent octopine/nopaline dehydrogenase family protein [Elioraea sp. Yellowstone]